MTEHSRSNIVTIGIASAHFIGGWHMEGGNPGGLVFDDGKVVSMGGWSRRELEVISDVRDVFGASNARELIDWVSVSS